MSGKIVIATDLTQGRNGLSYNPLTTATGVYGDDSFVYNKFGNNPDVDTATDEDIWDNGGNLIYLEEASILNISSSSANDAPLSEGLKSVLITGVDGDYNIIEEVVELNGVTPVQTTQQYLRLFRMRAFDSDGTYPDGQDAAGVISAVADSTGDTQAVILQGNTTTKMSHFTVPAGYTATISHIYSSGGAGDDYTVDIQVRREGGIFATSADLEISNSSIFNLSYDPFIGNIKEKSDIKFKAKALGTNTQVRIGYGIVLIKNLTGA